MKISKIILYDEPSVPEIQVTKLQEYLKENFPVKIEVRKSIIQNNTSASLDHIEKIASCRILNPYVPSQVRKPTIEEINFEKENFDDTGATENIVMYDGFDLQKTFLEMIPEDERSSDFFHLIFTNKLTCTYDTNDYRYHGRALIASNPSIISTTGIIEAPAKPRQYYFELISNMQMGLNIDAIKQKYKGQYLEDHDNLLGKVVRGYAMQALFYYLTEKAFCDDRRCILFNAHWQKDLLYSQIESGKLCDRHKDQLDYFLKKYYQ